MNSIRSSNRKTQQLVRFVQRNFNNPLPLLSLSTILLLSACGDSSTPLAADSSTAIAVEEQAMAAASEAALTASTQLDKVIREFARVQLDEDDNTELQDVSAAGFQAEIERNLDLLEHVRAIDSNALSFDESIDQGALIGLLESDTYSAQARRMWGKDAALYVPAGQIGLLLESQSAQSPADRADALMVLLAAIPQQLQNARDNLINPPKRFTEAGIFKTQGTTSKASAMLQQACPEQVQPQPKNSMRHWQRP